MKAKKPEILTPAALPSPECPSGLPVAPRDKIVRRFLHAAPLVLPKPSLRITRLGPLERSTETLRFSVLRLEFWLSSNGRLRECLRLGILLWCILSIASVFLAPLVTDLLSHTVTWTDLLGQIVHNLMLLPFGVGTFLLSLAGAFCVFRLLFRR